MSDHAHVYRLRPDTLPAAHDAVVLSGGPFVTVYDDNGWHESGGGFNSSDAALDRARYLAGTAGTVHDHT